MEEIFAWIASASDSINKVALALVAVVTMVVSPWLQWRITRRQLRLQRQIAHRQIADSIASRRQEWIDGLRADMAEYLTRITTLESLQVQRGEVDETLLEKLQASFDAADSSAHMVLVRIRLRLNPNEEAHKELVRRLEALGNIVDQGLRENVSDDQFQTGRREFARLKNRIVEQTQSILKAEWERVKRGEI